MRPFCIATIGTILGIIMGLYLKSIALLVFVFFITIFLIIILFIYNPTFVKKYTKIIFIFLICMLLFSIYTFLLEQYYEKINKTYDNQEIEIQAIVISDKIEKKYKEVYQIQVIQVNKKSDIETEFRNSKDISTQIRNYNEKTTLKEKQKFKMILNLKKDKKTELQYGNQITFVAKYEAPSIARNEGGFDYSKYLKTKQIVGITNVKVSEITVTEKNQINIFSKAIHDIKNKAITKIKKILPKDTANLCTGLLLGDKTELSEDIQEDFRKSNLSHMLAISGAHVSYVILGITTVVQKLKLHKRWSKVLLITFLFFFMALVGFTPSVVRACIMASLQLLANILFKKSNTYQNLAISSFVILLANPYAILDIGFQLSFAGTIGIVLFSKRLLKKELLSKIEEGNSKEYKKDKEIKQNLQIEAKDKRRSIQIEAKEKHNILYINIVLKQVIGKIKEMCIVTISANILIIPIMMYHFNTISLTFLISNLLASPILGICLIISMIFLVFLFIFLPIAKIISFFLQPILQLLILIAEFSGKLPLSQILVPTPTLWQIISYYTILGLVFLAKSDNWLLFKLYKIQPISTRKLEKLILLLLILFLIFPYFLRIFPQNKLTINFIDVGQGDSMLIQTPSRKNILIDGGGSETGSFDVGEKTLLPYLLDKGILKIDYMIFSHFDSDHCQGLFTIIEKLKVKNAVISKQGEESENFKHFITLAKQKKVKVITVQAGDFIQIDKQCSLYILFPNPNLISTNILNNNSIVTKFTYKFSSTKTDSESTSYPKDDEQSQEFTVLLTGDIEKIAENKLIEQYRKNNQLQANILKVAHHRF